MSVSTPRMRMFAGPNGSGKTSLRIVIPRQLWGVYLNPDEIEEQIRGQGFLDLAAYNVSSASSEALLWFRTSAFLQGAGLSAEAEKIDFVGDRLLFRDVSVNAYFASVAADFIRQKLLEKQLSFTFETVMSSPDKITLLDTARRSGFRTYLYYVATEDPRINISRVLSRIGQGGHSVPEDKIVSRYHRSLGLLMDAIHRTNRAYIFDNSGLPGEHTWIAEITEGRSLELKTDRVPTWFKRAVLDKITTRTT